MNDWPPYVPRDPDYYTRRAFTCAFGVPVTALVCARYGSPALVVLPMVVLAVAWHVYADYKSYWRALVPDGPPAPYVRAVTLGATTGLAFAILYYALLVR